jgi:hypothetical protein
MKYNNLHFSNRKFEGAALNLEGPEKKGTLRLARKTTTDLIFRGKSIDFLSNTRGICEILSW